ncbi:pyridoxamine 5'-phosphate oxidase [Nocardioides pacificus]
MTDAARSPRPVPGLTPALAALREDYTRGGLEEHDLAADPITMFGRWFDDARSGGLHEPNAMVLATVSPAGRPSSRMVLLKGVDDEGFVFFSNRGSHKGRDLTANPACALLFPWHPLERQIRIEGSATELPRSAVEDYFAQRPRGSQLGAWASPQSREVAGRHALAASYDAVVARFADDEPVPVPDEWSGWVVAPETVEFWQGRPGRMHDRLVYERDGSGWRTFRLAP